MATGSSCRAAPATGAGAPRRLIGIGFAGAGVAALCCATPVLAVPAVSMGLSAWLARLDDVLLPAIGFFLALAMLGVFLRRRKAQG